MSAVKRKRVAPPQKCGNGEISLILFSNKDGMEIAGVDLTGKEFQAMQSCAARLKTSLARLLYEGVFHMSKTGKLRAVVGPCLANSSSPERMKGGAQ